MSDPVTEQAGTDTTRRRRSGRHIARSALPAEQFVESGFATVGRHLPAYLNEPAIQRRAVAVGAESAMRDSSTVTTAPA
jgi:hypothetical protein